MFTPGQFNELGTNTLPGHVGLQITFVGPSEVRAELPIAAFLMAPNGFLAAGSIVTLADTAAGYGCVAHLPEQATGFTTLELKCNHLATARQGTLDCTAKALHLGRTTQLWDAEVTHRETGRTLAHFRCTQLLLYGTQGA
jgi:uncharacterized protein (TIGR00369 family)